MNLLSQINIRDVFGSPYGRTLGFADLVSLILSNAVGFAAIILLILIIVGAFMMIAGAGSGNKENVARGKTAVTAALVGFLVIFVSYWIVVILGRILGFSITDPSA